MGAAVACVALLAILVGAGPVQAAVGWSAAPDMSSARASHTATLLAAGKVLVTGGHAKRRGLWGPGTASADLYDPRTNTWSRAPSMSTGRIAHAATLLANGKLLVTGGFTGLVTGAGADITVSAQLYDPASNTWLAVPSMSSPRDSHTATLLANGKVLVVGGRTGTGDTATAELYDPASNTWSPAPSMSSARNSQTATLLANGKVLVAGGITDTGVTASAELYDPASNTWSPAPSMSNTRTGAATQLPDGKILVTGGKTPDGASAELYDPQSNTWWPAPSMSRTRYLHSATLLGDGKVLATGGYPSSAGATASAELYDPQSNTWSPAPTMNVARDSHTATRLTDGRVLVTGGHTPSDVTASAELYGAPPPPIAQPWTLTRTARPRVAFHRGAMRVSSGFVAGCPAGGPDCRGRLTLKLRRRAPSSGRMTVVSLTRKIPVMVIKAGTQRRVTFRLSASGARRLRRLRTVRANLRGSLRTGSAAPVVHRATLRLTAPARH